MEAPFVFREFVNVERKRCLLQHRRDPAFHTSVDAVPCLLWRAFLSVEIYDVMQPHAME